MRVLPSRLRRYAAAHALAARGAKWIYAAVTHGVLTAGASARLGASPIEKLFFTDTVEGQPERFSPKVEVISVAPLFGEAVRSIHHRRSISVMFSK